MADSTCITSRSPENGPGVAALHSRWVDILGRLTGAPIGHAPPLSEGEIEELHATAAGIERQVAATPARQLAEVTLKLKMAGCAILFSGAVPQLIESAVNDLRELDPRLPLNDG
jgi:hypothetical protein